MDKREVRRIWIAFWSGAAALVVAVAIAVALWAATESPLDVALLMGLMSGFLLGAPTLLVYLFAREDYLDIMAGVYDTDPWS